MKYRREIDGLRAVAVLPVILYHAGFEAFSGGFVGVDIFFVISGYLITTIILADKEKGRFSLINFYERRARRILPVLFFVMLCCFPFAWLWLLPNHLKDFSQSLAAVSVFSSNILFMKQSGYFATAVELKPLLHTWSLAVEEQYYLLFPLFIMLMWKLRKRLIFGSLIVIAVSSLALAQFGSYKFPNANFYILPTRGWELAIGALIAFYFLYKKDHIVLVTSNKAISESFGLIGIILIFYSIFSFDQSTPFPSFYALIPTIGSGLIIIFATNNTLVGKFLGTKLMVGIGLISYSTYLWHQPLFVFARHRSVNELSILILLILSVLSIILAYFSWRFVEIPFRDKEIFNRKKILKFSLVGSVLFIVIGLTGQHYKGFKDRKNSNGISLGSISEKVIKNTGLSRTCDETFTLSKDCRTSDDPEIIVWGDSYAMHLVDGIMAANPSAKIIQMTKSACGPFFDIAPVYSKHPDSWAEDCFKFNTDVHDWLKSNKTVKYAVLSSPFTQYLAKNKIFVNHHLQKTNKELVLDKFINTLEELKFIGITPIVFSPPPTNGKNIGECLVKADFFNNNLDECNFNFSSITDDQQNTYDFLSEIGKNYSVVRLEKNICENNICKANFDSVFIYRDSGHLSHEGSSLLGKKMEFYDLIVGKM